MLELQTGVKQWSGKMAKRLGWQRLRSIVDDLQTVSPGGVHVEFNIPYADVKDLLEGVGSQPGNDEDVECVQELAKYMFKDIAEKASLELQGLLTHLGHYSA